jgi:transcriptional regulator of nitric oxide reductase
MIGLGAALIVDARLDLEDARNEVGFMLDRNRPWPRDVDVDDRGDPPRPGSILGYAFWTTDLQPLERGYDGPIKLLVGLGLDATITGVILVEHREPFGDFSIEPPAFAAQFAGKDVRDAFKVGDDVDAVTRATITVTSATRAVRNGARRVARAFLTPPGTASR